jgi:hypothetical protein
MFLSAATSLFLFTLSIKDGYLVSASTSELSHGHVFTNHHQISDSVSNVLNDATDLEADKKDENVSDSCSVPSMYKYVQLCVPRLLNASASIQVHPVVLKLPLV